MCRTLIILALTGLLLIDPVFGKEEQIPAVQQQQGPVEATLLLLNLRAPKSGSAGLGGTSAVVSNLSAECGATHLWGLDTLLL
jgi:hypothetical protein